MLRELLAADIFKFMLVFARLGAAMMLMPALGSTLITTRTRLALALLIAFVILPLLADRLPPQPKDIPTLALLIVGEVTVGLFLGLIMQGLLMALDLAGNFIGYSVGLTNAFVFDAATAEQSQLLIGFLNTTVITLMFLTDMHHMMLRAVVGSYDVFGPGGALSMGDLSSTLVGVTSRSFIVGMQLSAPLVVFSLVFNIALGLINRLVPQMQVFFVGMPLQIFLGLALLMVGLPPILLWFVRHFADGVGAFLP